VQSDFSIYTFKMINGVIFVYICEKIKASNNGCTCQICLFLTISDLTLDRMTNDLAFLIVIYDYLVQPLLPTDRKHK
jgi:hypothetical protein